MSEIPKHRGAKRGIKHASHLKKAEVKAFVLFCLREDIAQQLEQVVRPHQLAVVLYERETGIKFPQSTAYKQRGRWQMINGELCEIRKGKDCVRPARPPPKNPRRSRAKPTEAASSESLKEEVSQSLESDVQ